MTRAIVCGDSPKAIEPMTENQIPELLRYIMQEAKRVPTSEEIEAGRRFMHEGGSLGDLLTAKRNHPAR